MDKKVDTVSFSVGVQRFEGQINMRRKSNFLDAKTTFFGTCCGKPDGKHFQAFGDHIDDVRRSLYEQAQELYGAKTWEKWVLVVVHTDTYRDRQSEHDVKRGLDAPRSQDLKLYVEVKRFLRTEYEGKKIWSDYYNKVEKPRVDTRDQEEGEFRMRDKYVGALLRDDERTRTFIERMQQGFATLEKQMQEFLSQDRIAENIERALATPDILLLEAPSDGVQKQED